MTRVVWKYLLSRNGPTDLHMPKGAVPLHVGFQGESLMLWALVDPELENEWRAFYTLPTGGAGFPNEGHALHHIGSAVNPETGGGAFPHGTVWHVFEVLA